MQKIFQVPTVLGIRDVYPGSRILIFYPSRIPDLGSRIKKPQQKRGVKKICCHTFFCSHKFHKIVNFINFFNAEEKNLGQFSKNYRTFTQKFVTKL